MNKADTFEFFRRLAELNPSPETELAFGNTYQLLVAVVLSAQATDVGVNKATRALFREVKTPQQMIDLGEEGLRQHIKTIGPADLDIFKEDSQVIISFAYEKRVPLAANVSLLIDFKGSSSGRGKSGSNSNGKCEGDKSN